MARPHRTVLAGLVATVVLAGCAADSEPAEDETGSVTSASAPGATSEAEPAADQPPRPGELTELARVANQQLAEDAERLGVTAPDHAPEVWEATLNVDIALTDADLDDPIAALPHPYDELAPVITELVVRADGPNGTTGLRMRPPFVGLRPELDGSRQVVTTEPGDEPPPTETWAIERPRIEEISLTVLDLDNAASVAEIIDLVGPRQVLLGRPQFFPTMSLADARAGIPATLPPLTGTTLPMPSDSSTDTDSSSDTDG